MHTLQKTINAQQLCLLPKVNRYCKSNNFSFVSFETDKTFSHKQIKLFMRKSFIKIFRTFDKTVALQCMFYIDQVPLDMKILKGKIQFLSKLRNCTSLSMCAIFKADTELNELIAKFNITHSNLRNHFRDIF